MLCTSVHYKPTDSHSYLLYSTSHPSHVKNSIPYSQFLRLRRLCSDDSDFSSKSEEMCQFFEKRGYPVSVVKAGHHRAQQFDRQSSLQTSQKDKNDRIPFTLTFHPHNHAVKSIILSNFKLLQNDPETGRIFSQPPLISLKRDKNVGNFLVRSALKTNEQPGTFKCARSRCKTCLFIVNTSKISGPKRSVKITDRFTCTSANVIYCITCTLCNKLYIGETGRRLGDRFREHLRSDEGLTLETSGFRISVRWPIYIINSVDKTKLLYTTSPPTQHHSFFRDYPFIDLILTFPFVQQPIRSDMKPQN